MVCRVALKDYFGQLSDELVLQIFRRLPIIALTRLNVVCKRWHRLMQDGALWRRFDLANGIIMSDVLIRFLNRGVRLLGLCRSEVSSLLFTWSIDGRSQLTSAHFHSRFASQERNA